MIPPGPDHKAIAVGHGHCQQHVAGKASDIVIVVDRTVQRVQSAVMVRAVMRHSRIQVVGLAIVMGYCIGMRIRRIQNRHMDELKAQKRDYRKDGRNPAHGRPVMPNCTKPQLIAARFKRIHRDLHQACLEGRRDDGICLLACKPACFTQFSICLLSR